MATNTHTPEYRNMTADQLNNEANIIYKVILDKLGPEQWLEIADLVSKFGSARFHHGAKFIQERNK